MKLIMGCSLGIVLLSLGINFANSQISDKPNTTLSLPTHSNQNITIMNISDSRS